jgi:NAD(P)-dependent dehydrogenase (short-subunit alcohol dehydrogenase family)
LTAEDFDRTLPHFQPGVAAIDTATEEAFKGSETMIDNAASKAALITLTKSVAIHPTQRGVRANVVASGPTWTPLNETDPHMPPDGLAQIGSDAPLGRAVQPEAIAPCLPRSDADSSYTVGEVIAVTGGMVDTRLRAASRTV